MKEAQMFDLTPAVSLGIEGVVSRYGRAPAPQRESSPIYRETQQGKALEQKIEGGQAKQLGIRVLATGVIQHQSSLYRQAMFESDGDPVLARLNLRTVAIASEALNQDLLSYLLK
jgi:hypothetical protein